MSYYLSQSFYERIVKRRKRTSSKLRALEIAKAENKARSKPLFCFSLSHSETIRKDAQVSMIINSKEETGETGKGKGEKRFLTEEEGGQKSTRSVLVVLLFAGDNRVVFVLKKP